MSNASDPNNKPSGEGAGAQGPSESDKHADEEWKRKAEEEKRRLEERLARQEGGGGPAGAELPEASFVGLLNELSLRALMALGQVPHPIDNQRIVDLEGARYAIDLLGVLEEKTRGNLTPEEENLLTDLLHNLRLGYVEVKKALEKAVAEGKIRQFTPEGGGPESPGGGEEPPGGGPKIII